MFYYILLELAPSFWINLEFLTRGWRYAVLSCLGDCFAKHLAAPAKEIQEVDITIISLNEGHIQDSNDLIRHAIWYVYIFIYLFMHLFIYLCVYLFTYYISPIVYAAIFLQYHPSQVWHALRLRMFASIYTWKRWLKHRHLPPRSTELPHEEVQSNPCLGLRGSGWLIATGSMEKPGLKPELLKLGGSMFKPRTLTLSSYSSSGFP